MPKELKQPQLHDVAGMYLDGSMIDAIADDVIHCDVDRLAWTLLMSRMPVITVHYVEELMSGALD